MLIRFFLALVYVVSIVGASESVNADTTVINNKIQTTQEKIRSLESEIAGYEKVLTKTQEEKTTLSSTIKTLDTNDKKLVAESSLTANKISSTEAGIETLTESILNRSDRIDSHIDSLNRNVRDLSFLLDQTLPEIVLSSETLSGATDNVYALEVIQKSVHNALNELRTERANLSSDRDELASIREKLIVLRQQLLDQRKILASNRSEKQVLLKETQNKESNYKKLLSVRLTEKQQFEQDLRMFELQLKQEIDRSKLPSGSGILSWPVAKVFITQYFGNTEFSRNNAQIYKGKGHNGIDLRASLGTPILSSAPGSVVGSGNTDLGCPGGSYGKWVLVEHGNGLSTLYAHLSLVSVNPGQIVARGETVGYSGATGYVTGPHLHFVVYATEGVQIRQLVHPDGTRSKCPPMPVSPLGGYLNPLVYLP